MRFYYYMHLPYGKRLELVKKPYYEIFYNRIDFKFNGSYFEIPAYLIHEILDIIYVVTIHKDRKFMFKNAIPIFYIHEIHVKFDYNFTFHIIL